MHRSVRLLLILAALCPLRAAGQGLEARVAEIFAQSCARTGCHAGPAPQMGLDLSQERFFASVVGTPSRERPDLLLVHPGEPDSSYLLMKVRGAPEIVGVRMPFTGEPLSDDQVATLSAWIDGLDPADAAREAPAPAAYPFDGWKVVNLPTTRTLEAGSWLFLIRHRFNPPLEAGYEAFFGLDGSGLIYLSLGYALTDRLLVALARSNAADDVELQLRYGLAHQRPGGPPVGVGAQAAVNWITETPPGSPRLGGEAFKLAGQLSLTRAFGDRIGLAVVPGVLVNPDERREDDGPLLTLGLGGRWRFHGNLSLVGEWVPIVSGYARSTVFGNELRFDSWGGGLEITTGGHVFQIVIANSTGMTTDQYLRGGDLDVRDALAGEVRLGFNIFRVLGF